MSTDHRYRSSLKWQGSTGVGYDGYSRQHSASLPGVAGGLELSSDPAFAGDPSLTNPEQLLLLAASSCQLLSFLAVAARARLDVLSYRDDAEAEMPGDSSPMRITRIVLRPQVVMAAGPTPERVIRLMDVAHRECFIANTLNAELVIEPTIEFR